MADFTYHQQFQYSEGRFQGSFGSQGVGCRPYHPHSNVNGYQQFQNFNRQGLPSDYGNSRNVCGYCARHIMPFSSATRDFRWSMPTCINYQIKQWYNGLQQYNHWLNQEAEGRYNETAMDFTEQITYFDKLKEAKIKREEEAERKSEKEAEPFLDNYISTLLTKSIKEINRQNGNVGKNTHRIKYKRPKKFNDNDPLKAYIIDDTLELLHITGTNVTFRRRRCAESIFAEINVQGHEDIQEISKVLLKTGFEDADSSEDVDEVKCYILMHSVDFITIPSKNLVYQRNKITGQLFTKSDCTLEDIVYLNLEERPVIFLEGYRQTFMTTEDGKLIRQCRLIILDSKQDEEHFYNGLRKRQERHFSQFIQGEDNLNVEVPVNGSLSTLEISNVDSKNRHKDAAYLLLNDKNRDTIGIVPRNYHENQDLQDHDDQEKHNYEAQENETGEVIENETGEVIENEHDEVIENEDDEVMENEDDEVMEKQDNEEMEKQNRSNEELEKLRMTRKRRRKCRVM